MVLRWLFRNRLQFVLGVFAGLLLSQLATDFGAVTLPKRYGYGYGYGALLHLTGGQRLCDPQHPSLRNLSKKQAEEEHDDEDEDDDAVAKELTRHVRVLVWVMTTPYNLDTKAVHVKNTWGRRANTLLFMSSRWNSSFPTVGLNVTEDRDHLTLKTMRAFRYVYDHHFHDADWFMKTDDDSYVILENLRYMLTAYDSRDPVYFGHVFNKSDIPQGYASGGAGYVLSKEALRRLVTVAQRDDKLCKQEGQGEDVEMGRCMMNTGVKLLPSLDSRGRTRFHCGFPAIFISGDFPPWIMRMDPNSVHHGIESISDYPISFHYITGKHMYELEFYVYHIRPFGISFKSNATSVLQRLTRIKRPLHS